MKFEVAEIPQSSGIDVVSLGLREDYPVDDGIFEIPDDRLDPGLREQLEAAGHTPIETDDDSDDTTDEDGGDDTDEAGGAVQEVGTVDDESEPEPADEYSDMDRSELYEEYKDRGGPLSWNDTTESSLRDALRVHDDTETFPTEGETE